MVFRRGFKAEANRIAVRVREKMGLAAISPIDPVEVCAYFDIRLIALSEVEPGSPFLGRSGSSFSAMTVPCGWHTAIVHNDSHHAYRQRSNICHELAHCFLGHKSTPPLTEQGTRAHDGGIESEANFLAGALLITNDAAVYIVQSGIKAVAQREYGVSQAMLNYRLRLSGAYAIQQRLAARRAS